MNEASRAYNLLRAYVNREWDRVKGIDASAAWRELEESLNGPTLRSDSSATTTCASTTPNLDAASPEDLAATARKILDVGDDADYETIRKAYEKINRRTQPGTFEEGSPEEEHASVLLRQATWAYQTLTKDVSATVKRFRSLEFE